jgi:hypothetical protein
MGDLGEDAERLLGGTAPVGHDDALGLFDDRAAVHRGLHLLGEGGGDVVEVRIRQGDRRVAVGRILHG